MASRSRKMTPPNTPPVIAPMLVDGEDVDTIITGTAVGGGKVEFDGGAEVGVVDGETVGIDGESDDSVGDVDGSDGDVDSLDGEVDGSDGELVAVGLPPGVMIEKANGLPSGIAKAAGDS